MQLGLGPWARSLLALPLPVVLWCSARGDLHPDRDCMSCGIPQEDETLRQLVSKHGPRNWSLMARGIPGRTGKSCRLRWLNQLNPNVRKGVFTPEEDAAILAAHAVYGNKWASIAKLLPGRSVVPGFLLGALSGFTYCWQGWTREGRVG